MLNHRTSRSRPRTFEQLTGYCLPSKPAVSLASILLDELSLVDSKEDNYVVDVCQIFLTQWSRCVEERYVRVRFPRWVIDADVQPSIHLYTV